MMRDFLTLPIEATDALAGAWRGHAHSHHAVT